MLSSPAENFNADYLLDLLSLIKKNKGRFYSNSVFYAEAVAKICFEKNLSSKELAKKLNFSVASIQRLLFIYNKMSPKLKKWLIQNPDIGHSNAYKIVAIEYALLNGKPSPYQPWDWCYNNYKWRKNPQEFLPEWIKYIHKDNIGYPSDYRPIGDEFKLDKEKMMNY